MTEEEIIELDKKDFKSFIVWIRNLSLLIGLCVMIYFIYKVFTFYTIASSNPDMAATGQIGDYIGGVVGTLFALAGTLLIYSSFKEQNTQNIRESFESSYFEMLRIQRSNVQELKYSKIINNEIIVSENRKVFKVIFDEFNECYREVNKFFRFTDNILTEEYATKLRAIADKVNPLINIKELAIIDISYSIVFFGISDEGEKVLRYRFKDKYIQNEYSQLIQYLKLKPKANDEIRTQNWNYIHECSVRHQRVLVKEIFDYNRNVLSNEILTESELDYLTENDFYKYYGGHQHRLGHYFRHLFQSIKYLHYNKTITRKQKYFYGKLFRAQLSNYEQALLFFNSLSTLGMKWEFTPEESEDLMDGTVNQENLLITEYALIKNLPGHKIFGFRYKLYYPKIEFESEE